MALDLPQIGFVAGTAVASGLRIYGTVAGLGFLHRIGALQLPGPLEVLAQTPVLVLATVLYVIEFIADKVPIVDTVWDAVHTFIRVPAAAVLGFAVLNDVAEPWRTIAALLSGTIALSTHGLKAGTRLALNTSPEPFTLQLPNLWHLATDLKGTLGDGSSSLDLVQAVHPTAAVAGTPRRVALQVLAVMKATGKSLAELAAGRRGRSVGRLTSDRGQRH